MFDELLHIDINTCSTARLQKLAYQTRPVNTFYTQIIEELLRRYDSRMEPTREMGISIPSCAAVANGHEISLAQLQNLNENDFDIILDLTSNRLRFRKNPAKHTPLKMSKCLKMGGYRIQILAHMLEHPGKLFYYQNYSPSKEVKESTTFNKTIAVFRDAFEQNGLSGPYIIKQFDWDGITGSKRGYVYKINPDRRYLVIHNTDENFRSNSLVVPG